MWVDINTDTFFLYLQYFNLSHGRYHVSPLTCHLSPITCHLSSVMNIYCSVMNDTWIVTRENAPKCQKNETQKHFKPKKSVRTFNQKYPVCAVLGPCQGDEQTNTSTHKRKLQLIDWIGLREWNSVVHLLLKIFHSCSCFFQTSCS